MSPRTWLVCTSDACWGLSPLLSLRTGHPWEGQSPHPETLFKMSDIIIHRKLKTRLIHMHNRRFSSPFNFCSVLKHDMIFLFHLKN